MDSVRTAVMWVQSARVWRKRKAPYRTLSRNATACTNIGFRIAVEDSNLQTLFEDNLKICNRQAAGSSAGVFM